jgi:hypothetical protein
VFVCFVVGDLFGVRYSVLLLNHEVFESIRFIFYFLTHSLPLESRCEISLHSPSISNKFLYFKVQIKIL